MTSPNAGYRVYGGILLISAAVLMLEVTLTRVFSVTIWYHFAFMVVSIALLGFGASGAFVTALPRLAQAPLIAVLPATTALFAGSALLALAVAAFVPFDPFRLNAELLVQVLYLAVYYVTMAVPFFFAGLAIALLLSRLTEWVSQLYFADLIGAGFGCLGVIAVLPLAGPQGAIALSAMLAAAAGLLFAGRLRQRRALALLGLTLALGLLVPLLGKTVDVHIPASKGLRSSMERQSNVRLLFTGWNSFSRVDVTEGDISGYAPGLSSRYASTIPPQLGVRIDADALTTITRFDGDASRLQYVEHLPTSLAYRLLSRPTVLVIGAGGGPDILAALYYNSPAVTGVELNPIIVSLVRERYREFAGDLYRDPRVTVVVDEGRNFVSRSDERYDLIQLSLVDTWAAVSSGAYSLAENYLYTREAFEAYYDHLTDRGIVTVTRWYGSPPMETLRLLTTATTALAKRGVVSPANHVIVLRQGNLATTAIRRQPFQPAEVAAVAALAADNGFELLYAPLLPMDTATAASNPVATLLQNPQRASFDATMRYNIEPVVDDNPFFFQFGRWRDFLNISELPGLAGDHGLVGYMLLLVVLAQALAFAALLIVAPLRRLPTSAGSHRKYRYLLTYFAALGVGFMFIEIALMQKLMLFLGYPVYAVAAVLATLLIASGVGSLLTQRWRSGLPGKIALVVVALTLLMVGELVALPVLIQGALGQPVGVRIALSVLVVAPLGLLLGMPFPLGLRLVHQSAPELVPWAWAVNGCASVVGPVLAVMLAMGSGFSTVLLAATVLYLVAMIAALLHGQGKGQLRTMTAGSESVVT